MIITELELKGFTRLALNNIKRFVLRPIETVNYIIGLNGSGKSSILSELTPLPANLKNYDDGGYKIIKLTHDNKEYILTSGVIKNKHEFIVDGQDLNISNNKKEQIDLVKEHFGITNEIVKVSTGVIALTTMSISDRRKYFSNISTIDYTYAIKTYNSLKSRHRDLIGGLKILQNKLENLESKRLSPVERESYSKSLDFLIRLKKHLHKQLKDIEDVNVPEINLEKIKKTIKEFSKLNKINDDIKELVGVAKTLEKEISDLVKELDTLKVDDVSEEELLRHNNISNEIVFLEESLPITLKCVSFDALDGTLYKLNSVIEEANMYIGTLYDIKAKADLETFKDILSKDLANQRKEMVDIEALQHELDELKLRKEQEAVTCPNCNHNWKVGYDEARYKKVIEILEKKERRLGYINHSIENITKHINEIEHNNAVYEKLYPMLKPFIQDINTDTLKQDVINLQVHRDTFTKIVPLKKEQALLKIRIDTVREMNDKNLLSRREVLEDLIEDKYDALDTVVKRLEEAERYEKYSNILKEEYGRLKIYVGTYKKNKDNELNKSINDLYKRNIVMAEDAIKEMESRLNDEEFLEREIKSLMGTLQEEKSKEIVLKKMVDGMSPSNGLIAKSINGFLGTFVNLMNDYIDRVWSHSLIIQVPSVEENELDYKFKVSVDGMVVDDISMLSTGQQEIINKVNIIVMSLFTRQETYPLTLDEPFVSLSPEHRDNAFKLIDSLERQKFIISHADSTYMVNDKSSLTIFVGKDKKYHNKFYDIE